MLIAPTHAPGRRGMLMITMGLSSLVFAALMLYRRRDIQRLPTLRSSTWVLRPAFGLGDPLANFGGLLHDDAQPDQQRSSSRSGTCAGRGRSIAEIRGLTVTHPVIGWGLVLGVVAIAGMPPLGLFMSEFLIISTTFARDPCSPYRGHRPANRTWIALVLRLGEIAFGEPQGGCSGLARRPLFAHDARADRRHPGRPICLVRTHRKAFGIARASDPNAIPRDRPNRTGGHRVGASYAGPCRRAPEHDRSVGDAASSGWRSSMPKKRWSRLPHWRVQTADFQSTGTIRRRSASNARSATFGLEPLGAPDARAGSTTVAGRCGSRSALANRMTGRGRLCFPSG